MRVAFATQSQDKIDVHFGAATAFAVYDITPDRADFIEFICIQGQPSRDDKIEERATLLQDCTVVYCTEIGGPAAARLVQQNIHPIKVNAGTFIGNELERFQNMLNGNPPPWLRKQLKHNT